MPLESAWELLARFSPRREGNSIWATVPTDEAPSLLEALYLQGWSYLSAISAVDWPQRGALELVYHLWSLEDKGFVHLKVELDRTAPEFPSLAQLFGGSAQVNEREIHELFGVDFPGNPALGPLFLEGWEGPPPFRKDFDWRAYVRDAYYSEAREEDRAYFRD